MKLLTMCYTLINLQPFRMAFHSKRESKEFVLIKIGILFCVTKPHSFRLTLIRFCGVRTDPRQIKTVGISQRNMIWQKNFAII